MLLHIRKTRVLLLLTTAFLLAIGAISILISNASLSSADNKLPKDETIDRICTARRQKCFQVVDRIVPSSGDEAVLGEETVTRSLEAILPSGKIEVDVVVRIKPEHNVSFFSSDTRLWHVDGEEMGADYLKAMTLMPFVTRVFRLGRRKESKRIALVGRGAAAILTHLRTLRDGIDATIVEKEKAVVQLTKRWFDIRDAPVVNEDGVEWMRKKVEENGTRFDVIFIDACERLSAQHCPDARFTTEENVKNLHRMLNDEERSLVIINFEIYNTRKWEMLQQQMGVLLSIFPHCITMDLKYGDSMIVACLTRPLPFYKSENPRASLDASMGFVIDQIGETGQELQYPRVFKEVGVHTIIEGKRESILHPVDKAV